METKLLAFHNDPKIKAKYLARVKAHAETDEIIHGYYWINGKGCAVGCTIHSNQHIAYETELGIPQILARIEDTIFEGSSNDWSKKWPEQFLKAIPVGADLSKVSWRFQHWLLLDPKEGCIRFARPQDKAIFEQIGSLLLDLATGRQISVSAARSAARSAAGAARSAAGAARSAAGAARSAAWAAAGAVGAAGAAAGAAAWAAEAAAEAAAGAAARSAAWAAAWATGAAAFESQGKKLLELLKEAR